MLFGKRHLQLVEVERDRMRAAGRFNARVMDHIRPHVQPGITTDALDRMVKEYTISHGHTPSQLGYRVGKVIFPKSCCISVNDVVCHGIPGNYVLQPGDIVNIDLTTTVNGWFGDSSETFLVGEVSDDAKAVAQAAFDCMHIGIRAIGPGDRVAKIGKAIVREARRRGYGVVDDFVGHGIGKQFHLEPSIPHVPNTQSHRDRIFPGMCFTVEPMINTGSKKTVVDKRDGWTVRTKDGGLSAQFEHTVLMTENGPEILTRTKDGPQEGDVL